MPLLFLIFLIIIYLGLLSIIVFLIFPWFISLFIDVQERVFRNPKYASRLERNKATITKLYQYAFAIVGLCILVLLIKNLYS